MVKFIPYFEISQENVNKKNIFYSCMTTNEQLMDEMECQHP